MLQVTLQILANDSALFHLFMNYVPGSGQFFDSQTYFLGCEGTLFFTCVMNVLGSCLGRSNCSSPSIKELHGPALYIRWAIKSLLGHCLRYDKRCDIILPRGF